MARRPRSRRSPTCGICEKGADNPDGRQWRYLHRKLLVAAPIAAATATPVAIHRLHHAATTRVQSISGPGYIGRTMSAPLSLQVVIEVPRGSFLKRGSTGHVDFMSPFPCPFNYGSAPAFIGGEGDLLDAVVLGPRLPLGHVLTVRAWGAVTLSDRGMSDDKLICSSRPVSPLERHRILQFFRLYARCKALLNLWRGRPGRNACDGWCSVEDAMARAQPRPPGWHGSPVEF